MDQEPLVSEEKEAGAELVRRFHSFMPVEAAFWIRFVDDRRWTLCIASEQIDDATFDHGYGEILRLTQEMKNPYIDPFQIRLLRGDDPLTKAALAAHRRYPGNIPTRLSDEEFGALAVDGTYIYPASLVASSI